MIQDKQYKSPGYFAMNFNSLLLLIYATVFIVQNGSRFVAMLNAFLRTIYTNYTGHHGCIITPYGKRITQHLRLNSEIVDTEMLHFILRRA